VGEIADLLINRQGVVRAALVALDGADGRLIAVPFGDLALSRDADGGLSAAAAASPDALAARPPWRESPSGAATPDPVASQTDEAGGQSEAGAGSAAERAAARLRAAAEEVSDGVDGADDVAARVFERAARRAEQALTPPPAGWVQTDTATLSLQAARGAALHGSDGERVGAVETLVYGQDGKPDAAILRIGAAQDADARRVSAPVEDLRFLRALEGGDIRAEISATRDDLAALPDYEG
jgi:hypothetical protein